MSGRKASQRRAYEPPFSPLIEQAVELAAQWHAGTQRKSRWRPAAFEVPPGEMLGVPVMAHVTAVALTVQRAGWDEATVAAAFLHDAVEDENRWRQPLAADALETLMGPAVTARVLTVTEQKYDAEGQPRPWQARKEDYLRRLRQGTPEAAAISLADKLHNLWTMNQALADGQDVFRPGEGRRALSAGPERQRWFYRSVLDATDAFDDPRLDGLRAQLRQELEAFLSLTAQGEG